MLLLLLLLLLMLIHCQQRGVASPLVTKGSGQWRGEGCGGTPCSVMRRASGRRRAGLQPWRAMNLATATAPN